MRNRFYPLFCLGVFLIHALPALGQTAVETDQQPVHIQQLEAADARFGGDALHFFRARQTETDGITAIADLTAEQLALLLTQQLIQSWDPAANAGAGDWADETRTRFTRNAAGAITEQLTEAWDDVAEAWVPSFRQVSELDGQGRTVARRDESWDPAAGGGAGDWEPSRRVSLTYDGQGNVEVNTTEVWDDGAGDYFLWFRSTSTYENGRLKQQVSESLDFFSGTFGPSLRTTFEYDGSGNTTQRFRETYDDTAGDWMNLGLRLWSYDSNGEETEDLEQGWDAASSSWVNEFREVAVFTPDSSNPTEMVMTAQNWDVGLGDWVNRDRGILTVVSATEWLQTEQDWDAGAGDWVNRSESSTTLDANGDFVEFVDREWDTGLGDWVNDTQSSFVRNAEGLIVESLTQGWDGAMWVNESRLLQTYEEFTTTAVEDENPKLIYRLHANYPNPFSGETRIEFALPAANQVTLEVFDMLGRRVTTLVDGLMAPGKHEVTLDASGMSGGLYVYRLQGEDVRISRTMLLVR